MELKNRPVFSSDYFSSFVLLALLGSQERMSQKPKGKKEVMSPFCSLEHTKESLLFDELIIRAFVQYYFNLSHRY